MNLQRALAGTKYLECSLAIISALLAKSGRRVYTCVYVCLCSLFNTRPCMVSKIILAERLLFPPANEKVTKAY